MNYLQFEFQTSNMQEQEKWVALLSEKGFEGFEEDENILNAFIPEHLFDDAEFLQVIDRFENVRYIKTIVENINWNKKWEEDFKPVLVDDFVAIRATFHHAIKGMQHEIIITPKMSFGTGHHATTYLMIQQMHQLDFAGKTVLDFGTGTGVLAILASKMGAKNVMAIDYDEWSITNTTENVLQNECNNILVRKSDKVPSNETYDIILANINLNVIVSNIAVIVEASVKGAIIVLSGFLKENEPDLVEAVTNAGLKYIKTDHRNDWIVMVAENLSV